MQLRFEDSPKKIAVDAGPANYDFAVSQPQVTLSKPPANWGDRLRHDSLLVIRVIREVLEVVDKIQALFKSLQFTPFKQREETSDLSLQALSKD